MTEYRHHYRSITSALLRQTNAISFKEGDQVWLYNPQRKKDRSPKLQRDWEGPYRVIKKINDVVYRIQKGPRLKMKVVHSNRLAKYCNKRRGLIYAEFIVGIIQQIFSYQLSGINSKYHAYVIISYCVTISCVIIC